MDKLKKRSLSKLVEFLGEVLGEKYEIVLHDISEHGSSVASIANNHISNRDVSSPLTGFALELLKDKVYEKQDYIIGYKAMTKQGKDIQGSTFFIKDEDKITGMLCINYDNNEYKDLADKILNLGQVKQHIIDQTQQNHIANIETVEYLSESIEDIIGTIIEPSLLNGDTILKPEKKQEIINALFDKGVFNIKGAVLNVSKILNMSEQSVYRYLKKVNG